MFTRLFSTAAASLLFVGLAACAADMDQPESSDGATASASETLPIDPRVDKFKTACESCKGCSVFTTQDNGCTVYHCGCDSTAGAVCASKAVDGALSASMETVGTGGAGGSGTKFQNAAIVASDLGAVLDSGSGSAGAGGSASGSTVKHPAGWGKTCGGIAAFACSSGLVCVDDPRDACDPKKGGADCGGVCVTQAEAKLLGTSCSATGSCAEGLICQLPSNPICSKANVDCHRTCGLPLPTKTLVKALPFLASNRGAPRAPSRIQRPFPISIEPGRCRAPSHPTTASRQDNRKERNTMFNRTYSLVAFAALALTACATEMSDDGQEPQDHEAGSQAEGLTKVDPIGGGPIGGGTGGSGGGTTTTPKKAPKVVSRTASGSQITVKFDRAVSTDEIMLAKTTVSVVRHAAGNFQTMNLATGATLSADKKSMTIQLSQPMKAGEVYYARTKWKSTPTSKELRAELGEIAVSNGHFAQVNDAVVGNLQLQMLAAPAPTGKQAPGASPLLATATAAAAAPAAAPLVHMVQLAEDPLPTAGTFKIKSMTPADLSEGNKRETDRVIVTFEGGTIDCTKTARGKDGFHLYSVTPDVGFQQDMYEDPAAPSPTNAGAFRGAIRCEEDENRIIFTTPGRLYGDAWFHLDLNAYSKEGNFIHKEREFKTERPGIVVSATRVENHYGTHDTCDSDGFFGSDNYCDIYVTSAIAARGAGQNGRIPEQGDFSEMRYFPSDANGGSRYLSPPRILFATAQPIDSVVDVQMWAIDADTDSEWKKIFEVAGEIAQATAATLAPFDPKDAAIAEGVSAGFQGLAKIIPTNEDDLLGSGRFLFTRDDARWGTQRGYETELSLSKNAPGRGPVKVFIYTEEFPRPWKLTFIQ